MSRSTVKNIGLWLHRLLAKSVIVPDKKNKYIKEIIHLLNFLLKHLLLRTYTIHQFFVNSDLRGKKLLLLQQSAIWRKKWGDNSVMVLKLQPDHNEFASIAFKEML